MLNVGMAGTAGIPGRPNDGITRVGSPGRLGSRLGRVNDGNAGIGNPGKLKDGITRVGAPGRVNGGSPGKVNDGIAGTAGIPGRPNDGRTRGGNAQLLLGIALYRGA